MDRQILAGIKIVELGQLIAGPFAARTLADFGANVIKVEPPEGDPLRKWRMLRGDTSVWWQVQSRNKESVCIDLRVSKGQALLLKLVESADVVIENFRPGTLEKWGLDWETMRARNPGLILLRVSGYGQTGPRRDEPGFAAIAEAMGGLRYLTGEPGRVPSRVGLSIGDTLAGLHGAIGVLLALYERDANGGKGQVIDLALYESVFNVSESLLPEYSAFGVVRQRAGGALPGIAPSNAYLCEDGEYLLIAANGDSIFRRLMVLIDRLDLLEDAELSRNDGRVRRADELDVAIELWTRQLPSQVALLKLKEAGVPSGRIYTAKDIAEDSHYRARGVIETVVDANGEPLEIPGIIPKMLGTPGAIRFRAPTLGEHTMEVLKRAGISDLEIEQLRRDGIVA